MSEIREKIMDVLENNVYADLRNAAVRELIASEIAQEVDEKYEMPPQMSKAEIKKSDDIKKGIFEQYLENPSSELDMNAGTTFDEEVSAQAEKARGEALKNAKVPKSGRTLKKNPVRQPKPKAPMEKSVKKQEKPQMADFFDKTDKKIQPPPPKKTKKRGGFGNLGGGK